MHNKKVIIDAIRNLNKTNRFKNTNVKNNFGKKNNMITAEEGVDTPIYKAVSVKPSNIEGKGLFAQQAISKGDIIGVSHIRKNFKSNGQNYVAPVPSKVLGYYNHSENPNVEEVDMGDYIIIKALKNIPFNSELTSNYNKNTSTGLETSDNFEKLKKGGSSKRAQMPSKKNSKAYSRSFEATNRFFAENPLFKKSKSRKNKIFDPNAKYYADGGESGCPEGYYYDPVQGCIPNDEHQKWLRDWYTNRKMSTPEGQEILNKIRPEVLERAKNFPPYSMSEELPENIAAAYDLEKNILELNKFLPEKKLEESKTHELSHYLTSGDKFLNLFDKDNEIAYVVDKNLITKPKKINTGNAKWDEELKKNFDEITSPEEIYTRIMTLRKDAGFNPSKRVTLKDLEDYFTKVKDSGSSLNSDIEDLKAVTKDNQAIVNLLNDMVSVPGQTKDLGYAKDGGERRKRKTRWKNVTDESFFPHTTKTPIDPRYLQKYPDFQPDILNMPEVALTPRRQPSFLENTEDTVNEWLGYPMQKAEREAAQRAGKGEDQVDNFRHPMAGYYTAQKIGPWGANALGILHEISTLSDPGDTRPWYNKLEESAEDIYNNNEGSMLSFLPESWAKAIIGFESDNNLLPDGINDPNGKNMYFKKDGGDIQLKLTQKEIDKYVEGGYVVEDISVPSLTRWDNGGEKRKRRKNKTQQTEEITSMVQPIAPDNIGQVIEKPEVEVNPAPERVPLMMKFSNEFQENNPYDAYYEKAAYDYLKKQKGWNEALGINKSNLPENVAKRIQNKYYKDLEDYVIKQAKNIQKQYFGKFDKKGNWISSSGNKNTFIPLLEKKPTGNGPWNNWGDSGVEMVYPEQLVMGPGAGLLGLVGRGAAKGIANLAKTSLVQGTKAALSQPIRNIPGLTVGNLGRLGFGINAALEFADPTSGTREAVNTVLDSNKSAMERTAAGADVALQTLMLLDSPGVGNALKTVGKGIPKTIDVLKAHPSSWFQTSEQRLSNPELWKSLSGETSWKDPLGKYYSWRDTRKIQQAANRLENKSARNFASETKRLAEQRALKRSRLPIKPVLTSEGNQLAGGQGRIYLNLNNPSEVIKKGKIPGKEGTMQALVDAGNKLKQQNVAGLENVSLPTKAISLSAGSGNEYGIQFMPWVREPLNPANPIIPPEGGMMGSGSVTAEEKLLEILKKLDSENIGVDYKGSSNVFYHPPTDSYRITDLNYTSGPGEAWHWNYLDQPVEKRMDFLLKGKKFENGGDIQLELTPEEIDKYVKGGYIVEDISVPKLNNKKELPKARHGIPEKEKSSWKKPIEDEIITNESLAEMMNKENYDLINNLKDKEIISKTLNPLTLVTYPNLLNLATRRGIQDVLTFMRSTEARDYGISTSGTKTDLAPKDLEAILKYDLKNDKVGQALYAGTHIPNTRYGQRSGLSSLPYETEYLHIFRYGEGPTDYVVANDQMTAAERVKLKTGKYPSYLKQEYVKQGTADSLDALYTFANRNTPYVKAITKGTFSDLYGPYKSILRYPFDYSGSASDMLQRFIDLENYTSDNSKTVMGTYGKEGAKSGDIVTESLIDKNSTGTFQSIQGPETAVIGNPGQKVFDPVAIYYKPEHLELEVEKENVYNLLENGTNEEIIDYVNDKIKKGEFSDPQTNISLFKENPEFAKIKSSEEFSPAVYISHWINPETGLVNENMDKESTARNAAASYLAYLKFIKGPMIMRNTSDVIKIPYSPFRFKFEEGGEYQLGDEVDEPTMQKLKEKGYTFEIVK